MLNSNLPVRQNPLYAPMLLSALPKKRSIISQSEHDRAIEKIAAINHNADKYVLAAHINWMNRGNPEKIGHVVPDIEVHDSSGKTFIEVETLDSLLQDHSISQYRVLNRCPHKAIVVLAIPIRHDKNRLNRLLNGFINLGFSNIEFKTIEV
ncbi:hypothetical protein [Paenibacillus sp. FSL H3-0286]|uniref:hypothetical protein n=1 Tax=Paenibacillus sp. FSL H3-0286 TaxID=2921427 RepID=UPI003251EAA3